MILNETEQSAMDSLLNSVTQITDWGLAINTGELASAVHVIQGFIVQHMLARVAPEQWASWYKEPRA